MNYFRTRLNARFWEASSDIMIKGINYMPVIRRYIPLNRNVHANILLHYRYDRLSTLVIVIDACDGVSLLVPPSGSSVHQYRFGQDLKVPRLIYCILIVLLLVPWSPFMA